MAESTLVSLHVYSVPDESVLRLNRKLNKNIPQINCPYGP